MQTLRASRTAGRLVHQPSRAAALQAEVRVTFGRGQLHDVRRLVAGLAHEAGLSRHRADELTVVVNELAANSVDHGGGRGTVRGWIDADAVVVEVVDAGDLARRERGRSRADVPPPRADAERGRGLWIARQLADDLDIRPADPASGRGTVVRVAQARR